MTFTHDGTTFDLTVTYLDVTGIEWEWTGDHNAAGEPLMGATRRDSPLLDALLVSLPDLYLWHGPLIPTPRKSTAAMYKDALLGVAS